MAMERSNPPWQQPHSFSSAQKNKMTWKKPKIEFYRPRGKISLSPSDIFCRHVIFSEISAIFRKSRDIFKTLKYRDIWSAIFWLTENITIFLNIANISAILSTLKRIEEIHFDHHGPWLFFIFGVRLLEGFKNPFLLFVSVVKDSTLANPRFSLTTRRNSI